MDGIEVKRGEAAMAASDHEGVLGIIAQKSSVPLDLPAAKTALIIVDLQRAFVQPDGRFPKLMSLLAPGAIDQYRDRVAARVVPNAKRLITAFRAAGLPVAFTGAGTRTGDGSDLAGWLRQFDQLSRQLVKTRVWPAVEDADWAMDDSVANHEGEIVVQKTTADPFISTDLADQLRSRDVSTVVVCGLTTDVCVAATARGAADRDFSVIVAEDACATLSEQLHRASLDIIGLAFGRVAKTDEIAAKLGGQTQSSALSAFST
jgi:biuret amidohydrolase